MVESKNLIVKSNFIVEASYKLSLGEQRVIYVLTSMIKPEDKEFHTYRLTVKEFAEILGTKSKDMYAQVSRYVEGLRDRDLTIVKEKSILKTKWLSSAEYFIDDGCVELCFDPKLRPYLLMLKERFTKLSLEQMVSFKSQYAGRIYELLKQYEKLGERLLKIEDLRSLLGISFEEYPKYANFKQKVIIKAKDEINLNSDLFIDFEEIKTGRKVTSLRFYIKSKKQRAMKEPRAIDEVSATSMELEEGPIKRVMDIMREHKITTLEAKKIYDSSKEDLDIIYKVYQNKKDKPADDIVALMISLVKPGAYIEPKKNYSKGSFGNYEQRTYDFDKLERGLLGWDNVKIDDTEE